jgi:hypothetical protein
MPARGHSAAALTRQMKQYEFFVFTFDINIQNILKDDAI